MIEEGLTGKIIKIFYKVYNELGYGFLEKIYHQAFFIELTKAGLSVQSKAPITVYYLGVEIGVFEADIIVEDKVIIELKATEILHPAHEAQITNYLRATNIEVGLLFNFGKSPEFKRKIFSNKNKKRSYPEVERNILENLFLEDRRESA